ncbi:MAG: pseudouridine-5'-phosphate glycosidase, partial [Ilumatobacter sp.]
MIEPVIDPGVAQAIASGRPVVALESTIFSHLGLPSPANAEALDRCLEAVTSCGAVPAVTAVLDGVPRVGIAPEDHERILGPARKAAERDLPVAVAQRWEFGATTVSAALALAHAAGVEVFATGGIGGVHREAASGRVPRGSLQRLEMCRDLRRVAVGSGVQLDGGHGQLRG